MTETKRTAEEWRSLIAEQASSGQSLKAFAASKGVAVSALQYWKYQRLRPKPEVSAAKLARVHVLAERSLAEHVDVILAHGRTLRVAGRVSDELFLRLIALLERPC